ncbi:hypothetical protein N7532_008957 [Penicillium argentinense]|uniref:Uncharacterized protein n=1 Tax=Penicillium argentinense TaxID=1131581 RepID=A0A9W9EYE0_9EURO|nr:uncharacterized protein N7532_008957 [Penicillium argentinense]KAJ5090273.1 hypothetical protein N7532_008957 [Penicillium argentinense]
MLGVLFGCLLIGVVFFVPYFQRRLGKGDIRVKFYHLPLRPMLLVDNCPLYFPSKSDAVVVDYYEDSYGEVVAGRDFRRYYGPLCRLYYCYHHHWLLQGHRGVSVIRITSGFGPELIPEVREAFYSLVTPTEDRIFFDRAMRDMMMVQLPARKVAHPEVWELNVRLDKGIPTAELIDGNRQYLDYWQKYSHAIKVPVMHAISEFDGMFISTPDMAKRMARPSLRVHGKNVELCLCLQIVLNLAAKAEDGRRGAVGLHWNVPQPTWWRKSNWVFCQLLLQAPTSFIGSAYRSQVLAIALHFGQIAC